MDHRALVNVVAFFVGLLFMVAFGVSTAAAPVTLYKTGGIAGVTAIALAGNCHNGALYSESLSGLKAAFTECAALSAVDGIYTYTKNGSVMNCDSTVETCWVMYDRYSAAYGTEVNAGFSSAAILSYEGCALDGSEPVGGVCPDPPTCTVGETMQFSVPGDLLVPLCRDSCRWENSGVGVCVAGVCFSEYSSTGDVCTVGPPGTPLSDGTEWIDAPETQTTTDDPAPVTDGDTVTDQRTVTTQTDQAVKRETVSSQTTIIETSVHGVTKTTTTTTTTHADGSQTITETVSYQRTDPAITTTRIGSGGSVTTQPGETVTGSRSTTSVVGADGSVTSTTTETGVGGDGEGGPEDESGECGILPQVVCDWFEEPELDTTPIEVPTIESTPGDYDSGLPSSSGCPAGFTVNLGVFGSPTISLQPLCDLASAIRPMVIAIAYLLAAFIVVGGRGK